MNFSNVGANSPDFTELLVLLVVILLVPLLWNSWKTAQRYADLPASHSTLFDIICEIPTKKIKSLATVFFQKLDAACKRFEKEGMVHIWCFRHILVIFGEESVKVFATDEASADKSADYVLLKESLGVGLITINGETWKRDRKLMNPAFHLEALKEKIPIFNENANTLVKKIAKSVDKPVKDLLHFLEYAGFLNICDSFLGDYMKNNVSEMEIEKIYKQIKWIQKYMSTRWFLPPTIATLHKFCTPSGWKSMKLYQEATQYGQKIISRAVESISRQSCDSKDVDLRRKSLLQILLEHQLKDPSFTRKHLQDHLYTVLTAGGDTAVYTMMWCLYLLGHHKDVQTKVYDEVQSVADEFITYENLCQLEYLECTIKETLRLFPTAPIFARHLKKDVKCGKYTVPKDTTIIFFLYRLHRNPEIYPDPESFDPDRFKSTNKEKRNWAHLPFSEGYRSCIGKKFAMMEMKVTLAYILRNYEITSFDRREDLELCWNFVLMPAKRLRMHVTPR